MNITSHNNYYEDFVVGDIFKHARGKTITEMDNVLLTNMVMNTAEGHFNEDVMVKAAQKSGAIFNQRVVFCGINLSMVLGLASQDTAENAVREIALDNIRLSHPVVHGDTLYAYTEVLEKSDKHQFNEPADCGLIRFRHLGVNQNNKLCVQVERTALILKRGSGHER